MEQFISLAEYYKGKDHLIIGFNDSQGVNMNPLGIRKNLLTFLSTLLAQNNIDARFIDAFSMFLNKTEHIEYFLRHNVTVEEVKWTQLYSAITALEKVAKDLNLPKLIENIGYLYALTYTIEADDKYQGLRDEIVLADELSVIYSSGPNDLMRAVANNPVAIKSDYKHRLTRGNYDYTVRMATNPGTLNKTIADIERNLALILELNHRADIYVLGAYVPNSMGMSELEILRDLILGYNQRLEELTKSLGLSYVDTNPVAAQYDKSQTDFHVATDGHKALASLILKKMHERKIASPMVATTGGTCTKGFTNNGLAGVIEDVSLEQQREKILLSVTSDDYAAEVQRGILWEKTAELKILEKSQQKTRKRSK